VQKLEYYYEETLNTTLCKFHPGFSDNLIIVSFIFLKF